MCNRFYQQTQNTSRAFLLLLLMFCGNASAASYSLPVDIGNGAFSSCSGFGPGYSCSGNINIGNNDTVVLSSNVTLTITGNLDVGKDVNISNGGFAFNINVTGNVDIDKDGIVSANITAGGDFKTKGGVIFNGDISAAGDVDIDKDNIINGNVAAGGNLNIDKKSVVNGICSPTHPQCTGGGSGGQTCTIAQIASDGEEFRGISGSSDSNIIAAGKKGSLYHYDGSAWTKDAFTSNEDLNDVEVVSSSLAYAVGKKGKVIEYDGWHGVPYPHRAETN